MVHTCCVVYCHHRRNRTENRSFHKFPWKNELIARSWVKVISRQNEDGSSWQPTLNDRVCSDHFKQTDYQTHTKTRTLHSTAIPSIFSRYPHSKQMNNSLKGPPSKDRPKESQQSYETPAAKQQRLCNLISHDHSYSKDLAKERNKNKLLLEKMNEVEKPNKMDEEKDKKSGDPIRGVERRRLIDSEKLTVLMASLSNKV